MFVAGGQPYDQIGGLCCSLHTDDVDRPFVGLGRLLSTTDNMRQSKQAIVVLYALRSTLSKVSKIH